MLKRLRQSLCIVVDAGSISLVLRQGWLRPTATLLSSKPWGLPGRPGDGLSDVLNALLTDAGLRHLPTRVVLSDVLMRTWRVEPPRNASRMQDCEAATAMRFQTIFDESPDDWLLSCVPDASHAFMAWAVRRSLVNDLSQVLGNHQLNLLCIEPEFIVLWNHWQPQLPANAWLGVYTTDSLVLGVVHGSRLEGVRRLPLTALAHQDAVWLRQAVQREADRLDLPAPAAMGLCGSVPKPWLASDADLPACTVLGTHANALSLMGVTA
jgi:hypothetical protein